MKQEIVTRLTSDGWVAYPDRDWETTVRLYKRFETLTRCHCNDDKEGIQVCLSVSEHQRMSGKSTSIELDVCGELKDESWVKLLNYGFGSDIDKVLASIPRLLAAWETLNNFEA